MKSGSVYKQHQVDGRKMCTNSTNVKNQWTICWEKAFCVHSRKKCPVYVETRGRLEEEKKNQKHKQMVLRRMGDYKKPVCHLLVGIKWESNVLNQEQRFMLKYKEYSRQHNQEDRDIYNKVKELFQGPLCNQLQFIPGETDKKTDGSV